MTSLRTPHNAAPHLGLALALTLAGCSGGGGGGLTPAPSPVPVPTANVPIFPASDTQVQISITFPAQTPSSVARRPSYISPSIESLTIAIDSAAPIVVNAPAPTGAPQTVVTTVPATPGSRVFTIAEYDMTAGGGNLLGRVTQTNTVIKGQLNTIAFTVNGQLAKIGIQPPASAFVEGSLAAGFTLVGAGPQTFTAVPEDADGNTILTPGAIPQLTASSASPTGVTPSAATGNTFTLQAPVPTQDRAYVAITVSGLDLDGKTVSTVFGVNSGGAFYIADYSAQKVRVFDENGTPLKLPPTSFADLTNPEGLAYVPGNPGSIVVTQTANFAAPYIVGFDQAGNPQPFAAPAAFPGLSRPLFLTYAPMGATGEFFVPDYYRGTISGFDPTGAPLPGAAGNFTTSQLDPVAAVFDPNDNQLYVTNDGSDTLTKYTTAGTIVGTVATGSHPMGVAFDSFNKSLYLAYGGTEGAVIDMGTPQLPGITQFTEALTAVANTGGFANTKTTAYFTGIAVDPYLKQVYVADAGDVAILAFSETGAAVTLPTGAFSTISATTTPASNPMAILFVP